MRNAIPMLMATLLAACGGGGSMDSVPAQNAPAAQDSHPVVFIGDSITAHWGSNAYADPVLSVLVPGSINVGIDGQNTEQMLARFQTDVLDAHPSVVVIEGGINSLVPGETQLNDPATIADIVQMGEEASSTGAAVIIELVPHSDLSAKSIPDDAIPALNAMLQTTCTEYGWQCVDTYTATSAADGSQIASFFIADHIHPDVAGYNAMWPLLRRALLAAGVPLTH